MSKIKVTEQQVNHQVSQEEFIKHGEKTTIGIFTLRNGFVIVEASSCVDPENYNEAIGRDICREHAKNKIWELEGYKLASQVAGQY